MRCFLVELPITVKYKRSAGFGANYCPLPQSFLEAKKLNFSRSARITLIQCCVPFLVTQFFCKLIEYSWPPH